MKRLFNFFIVIFFLFPNSYIKSQINTAVIDFSAQTISSAEARPLTDRLRTELFLTVKYLPSYKFEYSTSQVIYFDGFVNRYGGNPRQITSGSLYMNEYCLILEHILEFGYSITKGDFSIAIDPNKNVLVNGVEVDKVSDMKFNSFFVGIRPEIEYGYMTTRIGLGNESYLTPVSSYNSKGIYLGANMGLIIPYGPFSIGLKIGSSGIIHSVSSSLSDMKIYLGFDVSFNMGKIPKKIIVRKPKPIPPQKLIDRSKPTIQIYSPEITQNIFRTEDFSVIISGKATDDQGVAFITVNGISASLKSNGQFQKRIKLKIGKNPVLVSAIDINDNETELKLTIIREEFIEDEEFSDVDFAPETGKKNKNGIAVVFGIEDYHYAPSVTYAYNDADIFREYLIKTFGYSRENIYFMTNERATKGEFEKVFSESGWLSKNVTPKSDIIIYYAGHGTPELDSKRIYLVPYDIDPNYATTGYALEELYQNLGKLKVNSITVILDACFSGGTRDNQPLIADSRPVYISVEGSAVHKNTVVFSAASGKEISSAYKQKLHGLFTYFFLKGLNGDADKNRDKKITVSEMKKYLEENVPAQARRMGREQHPHILGADNNRVLLSY